MQRTYDFCAGKHPPQVKKNTASFTLASKWSGCYSKLKWLVISAYQGPVSYRPLHVLQLFACYRTLAASSTDIHLTIHSFCLDRLLAPRKGMKWHFRAFHNQLWPCHSWPTWEWPNSIIFKTSLIVTHIKLSILHLKIVIHWYNSLCYRLASLRKVLQALGWFLYKWDIKMALYRFIT